MKEKRRILAWMMVLLLLLSGCGRKSGMVADELPMQGDDALSNGWSADRDLADEPESKPNRTESQVFQNSGAKLIRRAELIILTEQFDQTVAALDKLVIDCGGYYESVSLYGGSNRDAHANRSGEYVVRVPAERFEEFQASTGTLGYVSHSEESNEDIGERYYDTEARLKTQRTKQERLLALLEKANSMDEIISLENALSEVEYEIEQLSSTLNHYDALVTFATIRITLNEVFRVTEQVGESASLWQRMAAGFAARGRGLVDGVQDFMVWISYHFSGIVILGLILVGGTVLVVKKKPFTKRKKNEE